MRAVLERLPEVFPVEALSRGAQRIEQKHVVHGHLFAWGARIKEHSADPNLNIYIYIHASEHLYTYVYIYKLKHVSRLRRACRTRSWKMYIYTPLRTYTHL